ncbi:MAG: hypothetical protein AABO57_26880 [Acidobacteriota bacterium]
MEQVVSFLFNHRQALFSKSQFSFGARPSMLLLVALIAGLALLAYFLYAVPAVRLALRWRVALIALRCVLVAKKADYQVAIGLLPIKNVTDKHSYCCACLCL